MTRSHARCWAGDHYEHVCQRPSGRTCLDCPQPAGTAWGPMWCPEHDVARLDRVTASLDSIAESLGSES